MDKRLLSTTRRQVKVYSMTDNFELIKSLLSFNNEQEFYFLQIIQRKKDNKESKTSLGTNNNSRCIRTYSIYRVEQLDKYKHEIIEICKLFNARAGISLNKRNNYHVSLEALARLAVNIKNGYYEHISSLYNEVCGQHHSDKDKRWIIDLDEADLPLRDKIISRLEFIEPLDKPDKLIAEIPSKSGIHLITAPFNTDTFSKEFPRIEFHRNNPTNLYIP